MTPLGVVASGALHRMVFREERGNLIRLLRRPEAPGLLAMTEKFLWII